MPKSNVLSSIVVSAVIAFFPALASADTNLLFHGPGRFKAEAERLQGLKYKGNAILVAELPADGILKEIEARGRAGEKISAIEIFGHGLPSGPYITGEVLTDKNDRLTAEKIRTWMETLRKEGVDTRKFFAPGATVTIRACYVGGGEIPKLLLDVLPEDGKVISDYRYYINGPSAAVVGGFWTRQRVTSRKEDFIYLKGNSGDRIAWDKRNDGDGSGSLEGTWTGDAVVHKVHAQSEKTIETSEGTVQKLNPGIFVIRKLDDGNLELNYSGNILIGTPDGSKCIFVPDAKKGGNMRAADVELKGDILSGHLIAANDMLYLNRELTLKRAK